VTAASKSTAKLKRKSDFSQHGPTQTVVPPNTLSSSRNCRRQYPGPRTYPQARPCQYHRARPRIIASAISGATERGGAPPYRQTVIPPNTPPSSHPTHPRRPTQHTLVVPELPKAISGTSHISTSTALPNHHARPRIIASAISGATERGGAPPYRQTVIPPNTPPSSHPTHPRRPPQHTLVVPELPKAISGTSHISTSTALPIPPCEAPDNRFRDFRGDGKGGRPALPTNRYPAQHTPVVPPNTPPSSHPTHPRRPGIAEGNIRDPARIHKHGPANTTLRGPG
jgi:hypothetical protein